MRMPFGHVILSRAHRPIQQRNVHYSCKENSTVSVGKPGMFFVVFLHIIVPISLLLCCSHSYERVADLYPYQTTCLAQRIRAYLVHDWRARCFGLW